MRDPTLPRDCNAALEAAQNQINRFRRSWDGGDYLEQLNRALDHILAAKSIMERLKPETDH